MSKLQVQKIASWPGFFSRIRLHGVEAGMCQQKALRAGLWKYALVKAQK